MVAKRLLLRLCLEESLYWSSLNYLLVLTQLSIGPHSIIYWSSLNYLLVLTQLSIGPHSISPKLMLLFFFDK